MGLGISQYYIEVAAQINYNAIEGYSRWRDILNIEGKDVTGGVVAIPLAPGNQAHDYFDWPDNAIADKDLNTYGYIGSSLTAPLQASKQSLIIVKPFPSDADEYKQVKRFRMTLFFKAYVNTLTVENLRIRLGSAVKKNLTDPLTSGDDLDYIVSPINGSVDNQGADTDTVMLPVDTSFQEYNAVAAMPPLGADGYRQPVSTAKLQCLTGEFFGNIGTISIYYEYIGVDDYACWDVYIHDIVVEEIPTESAYIKEYP